MSGPIDRRGAEGSGAEGGRADRRVEIDGDLPPAEMPARLLNEMASHARETYPEECCGLLLGDARERFQDVVRCANVMTRLHRSDPARYPRDGREAFHMNEQDYLDASHAAEDRGLAVTGIYHSHVGYGAYLSEMDQAYALQPLFPFPDADHVVLSILEGRAVVAAGLFERAPGSRAFSGRAIPMRPRAS